jgi:hypothetical protein
MRERYKILLGIIFFVLLVFYAKRNRAEKELKTKSDGIPTIGFVENTTNGGYFGKARLNFTFNTSSNKKIYIVSYHRPNNTVEEGDKYLVYYLPERPQKAIMFFDYPIKDSADFIKSIKELSIEKNEN